MTTWPRPAWRGRVAYRRALDEQRARREAILAGRADDALWLLEHDPVFTAGRRGVEIVPDASVLRRFGADWVRTERGGLATWHGPGQLVGYLIADVASRGLGVRDTVDAIEAGLVGWLGSVGVAPRLRPEYRGVWLGDDKIAAIGLHVRHGVTLHGFALNLTNDLAPFGAVVPCGIREAGVTRLQDYVETAPAPETAANAVGEAIVAALSRSGLTVRAGLDTAGRPNGSAGT